MCKSEIFAKIIALVPKGTESEVNGTARSG